MRIFLNFFWVDVFCGLVVGGAWGGLGVTVREVDDAET